MKRVLSFIILSISLSVFASEDSIYDFSWLDKDKEVYVLQNRKFRKKNNFYIGGTIGRAVNGAFIDSNEINLLAGYFFKENWGLEFSYTKSQGETNKTHDAVNGQGSVAFFRKVDTAMSALVMWSPFYSKINTFNKIFYYDWMFGLGLASVDTLDNRNEFKPASDPDYDSLTKESNTGLTWTTALRFYISESWSSRIDFKAIHMNADSAKSASDTEKKWNHYYNFNVGINYTF